MFEPPVFINCRDRVSPLRSLVEWLERSGHGNRITLLDNDSTWPPLLDYYEQTPHVVVRYDQNLGSHSLWETDLVPDEPYVYAEDDVVPAPHCPPDAVEHLAEQLDRHPQFLKAALGIYLDDLPSCVPFLDAERERVAEPQRVDDDVFATISDNAFALYQADASFTYATVVCDRPYQAKHLSWYSGYDSPISDEDAHYIRRADTNESGSSWAASIRSIARFARDHPDCATVNVNWRLTEPKREIMRQLPKQAVVDHGRTF